MDMTLPSTVAYQADQKRVLETELIEAIRRYLTEHDDDDLQEVIDREAKICAECKRRPKEQFVYWVIQHGQRYCVPCYGQFEE